jgi:hypothetical protein
MSDHIYFGGDPAQDSARRHLERVLTQPQPRRWPLLAAIFAGGTAFTLWRVRQNRRKKANGDGPGPTSPEPRRNPLAPSSSQASRPLYHHKSISIDSTRSPRFISLA